MKAQWHEASKWELVSTMFDEGAGKDHLSDSTLRGAVDALERPRIKGCSFRWGSTRGTGDGPEEIDRGRAEATPDFDAEREEDVVLGCGGW